MLWQFSNNYLNDFNLITTYYKNCLQFRVTVFFLIFVKIYFIPVMAKTNFQKFLQKSFKKLKKHFLLSMLKTVVLIDIFVETVGHFQDFLMNRKKEKHLFYYIINVFTVTFD